MGNNKKFEIKGTKKQKILLGVQIFIVIFMLVFAVAARHVLKIEDSIISNVIFICVAMVFVLMNIINLSGKDSDEDNKTEK